MKLKMLLFSIIVSLLACNEHKKVITENIVEKERNCLSQFFQIGIDAYKNSKLLKEKVSKITNNNFDLINKYIFDETERDLVFNAIYKHKNIISSTVFMFPQQPNPTGKLKRLHYGEDFDYLVHTVFFDTIIQDMKLFMFIYHGDENQNDYLGFTVMPKEFQSPNAINRLKCELAISTFFNYIPDCICDWNNMNNYKIRRRAILFTGIFSYLNDCLEESGDYK